MSLMPHPSEDSSHPDVALKTKGINSFTLRCLQLVTARRRGVCEPGALCQHSASTVVDPQAFGHGGGEPLARDLPGG